MSEIKMKINRIKMFFFDAVFLLILKQKTRCKTSHWRWKKDSYCQKIQISWEAWEVKLSQSCHTTLIPPSPNLPQRPHYECILIASWFLHLPRPLMAPSRMLHLLSHVLSVFRPTAFPNLSTLTSPDIHSQKL